jgi:proline racemase
MRFSKMINTIDTHTMGEPTRIITGIPALKGSTMAEKQQYLIDNMDYLRTAIMHEPRGHKDMFGAVIAQPCRDEANLGVIFMDGGGYLNMCGHGSIGVATVAIETGMLDAVEPVTEIIMDAPAGLIKVRASVKDGLVSEASFINVPSFLYKGDVEIDVPKVGKGKLIIDIAFGGSFFALVRARDLGLEILPENSFELTKAGLRIRAAVNEQIEIKHPTLSRIKTCDLVKIYDNPAGAAIRHPFARNVVVFGEGQIDRSPCGTGTCAKLAALYAKGKIKEDELYISEGILGTRFKGKIVGKQKVADYDAIIPEITGSAYITGFNTLVIDERDPVKHGFIL